MHRVNNYVFILFTEQRNPHAPRSRRCRILLRYAPALYAPTAPAVFAPRLFQKDLFGRDYSEDFFTTSRIDLTLTLRWYKNINALTAEPDIVRKSLVKHGECNGLLDRFIVTVRQHELKTVHALIVLFEQKQSLSTV